MVYNKPLRVWKVKGAGWSWHCNKCGVMWERLPSVWSAYLIAVSHCRRFDFNPEEPTTDDVLV